jgi:hypothetical protein
MSRDSASELRHKIDVVIKSLRLLKKIDLKLESLTEMFLINLLCSRLHEETRKAFQLQLTPTVYSEWSEMHGTTVSRTMTIRPAVQHNIKKHARSPTHTTHTFHATDQLANKYLLFQQTHYIYQCPSFLRMKPDDCYTSLVKLKVCHNCLGSEHAYNECKSGVRKHCQKKNHSLLHFEKRLLDLNLKLKHQNQRIPQ